MPPSILDPVQVDQAAYFPTEDIVSLAVSWMLPEYSNGVLRHYQIRVGSLPIRDNRESGITFLSRTAIGVSEALLLIFSDSVCYLLISLNFLLPSSLPLPPPLHHY